MIPNFINNLDIIYLILNNFFNKVFFFNKFIIYNCSNIIINSVNLYDLDHIDCVTQQKFNNYFLIEETNNILKRYYMIDNQDIINNMLYKNFINIEIIKKQIISENIKITTKFVNNFISFLNKEYFYIFDNELKNKNKNNMNILNNAHKNYILFDKENIVLMHNNLHFFEYKAPNYNDYSNTNLVNLHMYQMYLLYTAEYNYKIILNCFQKYEPYIHFKLPIDYTNSSLLIPMSPTKSYNFYNIDIMLNNLLFDNVHIVQKLNNKLITFNKKNLNILPIFYNYKYKNYSNFLYFSLYKNNFLNYINKLDLDTLYPYYDIDYNITVNKSRSFRNNMAIPYFLEEHHWNNQYMFSERSDYPSKDWKWFKGLTTRYQADSLVSYDNLNLYQNPLISNNYIFKLHDNSTNRQGMLYYPFLEINLFNNITASKKFIMNSSRPEDQNTIQLLSEPMNNYYYSIHSQYYYRNFFQLFKNINYNFIYELNFLKKFNFMTYKTSYKENNLPKFSTLRRGLPIFEWYFPLKFLKQKEIRPVFSSNFLTNISRNIRLDQNLFNIENIMAYPLMPSANIMNYFCHKINNKFYNNNLIKYVFFTKDINYYSKLFGLIFFHTKNNPFNLEYFLYGDQNFPLFAKNPGFYQFHRFSMNFLKEIDIYYRYLYLYHDSLYFDEYSESFYNNKTLSNFNQFNIYNETKTIYNKFVNYIDFVYDNETYFIKNKKPIYLFFNNFHARRKSFYQKHNISQIINLYMDHAYQSFNHFISLDTSISNKNCLNSSEFSKITSTLKDSLVYNDFYSNDTLLKIKLEYLRLSKFATFENKRPFFNYDTLKDTAIINFKNTVYSQYHVQEEQQYLISNQFTNKFLQKNNMSFFNSFKNRLYLIELYSNFSKKKRTELDLLLLNIFMKQKLKYAFFLHNPFSYRLYKFETKSETNRLISKYFLKIVDFKPFFAFRQKLYRLPKSFNATTNYYNYAATHADYAYHGSKCYDTFDVTHLKKQEFKYFKSVTNDFNPYLFSKLKELTNKRNYFKLPLFERKFFASSNAININSSCIFLLESNLRRLTLQPNTSVVKTDLISFYLKFLHNNYIRLYDLNNSKLYGSYRKEYLDMEGAEKFYYKDKKWPTFIHMYFEFYKNHRNKIFEPFRKIDLKPGQMYKYSMYYFIYDFVGNPIINNFFHFYLKRHYYKSNEQNFRWISSHLFYYDYRDLKSYYRFLPKFSNTYEFSGIGISSYPLNNYYSYLIGPSLIRGTRRNLSYEFYNTFKKKEIAFESKNYLEFEQKQFFDFKSFETYFIFETDCMKKKYYAFNILDKILNDEEYSIWEDFYFTKMQYFISRKRPLYKTLRPFIDYFDFDEEHCSFEEKFDDFFRIPGYAVEYLDGESAIDYYSDELAPLEYGTKFDLEELYSYLLFPRIFDTKEFFYPFLKLYQWNNFAIEGTCNPVQFYQPLSSYTQQKLLYFRFFGFLINNNLIFGPYKYNNVSLISENIEYDFFQDNSQFAMPYNYSSIKGLKVQIDSEYSWFYLYFLKEKIFQFFRADYPYNYKSLRHMEINPAYRYQIFFIYDLIHYFLIFFFSIFSYIFIFFSMTIYWFIFIGESIFHLQDWLLFPELIDWTILNEKYNICSNDIYGKDHFSIFIGKIYFSLFTYAMLYIYYIFIITICYPFLKIIFSSKLIKIYFDYIFNNFSIFIKKNINLYNLLLTETILTNRRVSKRQYQRPGRARQRNKKIKSLLYEKKEIDIDLYNFKNYNSEKNDFIIFKKFIDDYQYNIKFMKYNTLRIYEIDYKSELFQDNSESLLENSNTFTYYYKMELFLPFILDIYSQIRLQKLNMIVDFSCETQETDDLIVDYTEQLKANTDEISPYLTDNIYNQGFEMEHVFVKGKFNRLFFAYNEIIRQSFDSNEKGQLILVKTIAINSFLKLYALSPLAEKNNYIYVPKTNFEMLISHEFLDNFAYIVLWWFIPMLIYKSTFPNSRGFDYKYMINELYYHISQSGLKFPTTVV